jgi:crotonobetainyl-CoA:carnitine CoA-transferase CaiB-like acyl-CoA transferase
VTEIFDQNAHPGPLAGLLVADFSRVLAGPFASQLLGDLGADVVKVERPGAGDDTRGWGPPFHDSQSTYFLGLNRNKRSICLDLAKGGDLELAQRLIDRADIVIESFRPGVMERFGLGAEAQLERRPELIYCSISAFGRTDEAAALPGYDLLLQALSGLMSVTGEEDGPPLKVGVALIDMICGLYATIGILAALTERDNSGVGQHVTTSLMQTGLAAMLNQASGFLLAGVVPGRLGNRHPSVTPYETFAASDGMLVVAVANDLAFARLCAAIGMLGLAGEPRFATNAERVAHRDELAELLADAFGREPVATWVTRLSDAGVPAGPINDLAEAFAFASRLGLGPIAETQGGQYVRPPVELSRTPLASSSRPPRLGEHSEQIRAWLEMD